MESQKTQICKSNSEEKEQSWRYNPSGLQTVLQSLDHLQRSTWTDLEIVMQSEVSQKEKIKYCRLTLICRIQENDIDYLISKAERKTQMQRRKQIDIMDINRERGSGRNWEIVIDIYTVLILCMKQISNENQLHGSGNQPMLCGNLNGKAIQKRGIIGQRSLTGYSPQGCKELNTTEKSQYAYTCIHTADSLCYTVQTNKTL